MKINTYRKQLNLVLPPWILLYFSSFMVTLGTYEFLRLSFLVWNWSLFKSIATKDIIKAIFWGLRFDACAISILFLPSFLVILLLSFVAPQKVVKTVWVAAIALIHIPFLVLNVIDIEFFNFAGRRFTLSSLFIFQEAQGKMTGFLSTYLPGTLAGILLIMVFVWGIRRLTNALDLSVYSKWKQLLIHFFIFIVIVILGRGGFQQKPIDFVDASLFNAPVLNNLVLNSSFSLIKSSDKDKLPQVQFFTEPDEYIPFLNGSSGSRSSLEGSREKKKQNIVIVLLESFSLEYMGSAINEIGYTPFLDELSKQSIFFPNAFSNGRRSIEGVSSILAGIPALMNEAFITSEFASNYFVGLGSILSEKKYHSSFFHGGNNGTMYFDRFAKSAGISEYYGANEYIGNKEDHDNIWGIYDGPFFKFFGKKLSEFPEPFFSMIFSLSSHHPYKIPEDHKNRYKKGPLEILESIQYTDQSLKEFFDFAKTQTWYENTLFIITADHTQKNLLPRFDNEPGHFRVPLIFFHPNFKWTKIDTHRPVQHIDIIPSVMDFLGFENKFKILLSESVFKDDPNKSVLLFNDNLYYQLSTDYISVWDKFGEIKHYLINDQHLQTQVTIGPEISDRLDKKLKASIQYFNQGMWDNRLYFPGK